MRQQYELLVYGYVVMPEHVHLLVSEPGAAYSGSEPYGITAARDGMIWYSESGVNPNTLVRFDPKTKSFAETTIPSGGGVVRNMVATKDGKLYLACSGVNKVAVVTP